jgi:hypothetical protein
MKRKRQIILMADSPSHDVDRQINARGQPHNHRFIVSSVQPSMAAD